MNEIFEALTDSLRGYVKWIDKAASPDELYSANSEAVNYFLGWSHAAIYLCNNSDDRQKLLEMIGAMCKQLTIAYTLREEKMDAALEDEFKERGGFNGEH